MVICVCCCVCDDAIGSGTIGDIGDGGHVMIVVRCWLCDGGAGVVGVVVVVVCKL